MPVREIMSRNTSLMAEQLDERGLLVGYGILEPELRQDRAYGRRPRQPYSFEGKTDADRGEELGVGPETKERLCCRLVSLSK